MRFLEKNMVKQNINSVFDRQIFKDQSYKIHKELFNLTCEFRMEDWKFIRTDKYWETIDRLNYHEKKVFTLKCVRKYLKKNY